MSELNPEFFFDYLLPIELRPDQFTYFDQLLTIEWSNPLIDKIPRAPRPPFPPTAPIPPKAIGIFLVYLPFLRLNSTMIYL